MESATLGFDKIIQYISGFALSDSGHEQVLKIRRLADRKAVQTQQDHITVWRKFLDNGEDLPVQAFVDYRAELGRCEVAGAYFPAETLVEIRTTLEIANRLRKFQASHRDKLESLALLLTQLVPLPEIEKAIQRILDPNGEIKDCASPKLAAIRQEIGRCVTRLHKGVARLMDQAKEEDWLHEENPTIRNGRLVLPIKVEYKRKVQGIIHGQSGTGATVYIEPLLMVEINNRMKELEQEEADEIRKILQQITADIRPVFGVLENNLRLLIQLDFLQACARFSQKFICVPPIIGESDTAIKIINGRHPLLAMHKDVIPLQFEPPDKVRAVVITGPNAGGKTVAMKTVGLLGQMAMAGLHIPADEGSRFPMLDQFLVDIGDQQSIEDDLSTFSSHIANLKKFVENATSDSLVLVDEFGTGTDPMEGTALAQAILERLVARGTRIIVTTHHKGLKAFANEHENVLNAAMEFDTNSLTPTYRLQLGTPGSSYALEIAERMGMSESVIRRAKQLMGDDSVKLERLLLEVEELKTHAHEKNKSLEQNKQTLDKVIREYEKRLRQVKEKEQKLDATISGELENLVQESRRQIENVVREIKEQKADTVVIRKAKTLVTEIDAKAKERHQRVKTARKPVVAEHKLAVGDWVEITGLGKNGFIERIVAKNGRAAVSVDGKTLFIALDNLVYKEQARPEQAAVKVSIDGMDVDNPVTSRLDLRGVRYDEAREKLLHYIDGVLLAGLERVEIIHGKGTGALQQMTHGVLREIPGVKKFYFEDFDQGGTGATIVEL